MLMRRIIPRVDLEGGRVVGDYRFEGHLDPADPVGHCRLYQSLGADEILLWESGPPDQGWLTRLELISRLAAAIHIPLTVAGGLSSAAAVRAVLAAGADRVCLDEAAVERPDLIGECAAVWGRARIMVAAEVKRRMGAWYIFFDHGRRPARKDALEWAEAAAAQGAGEVLLVGIRKESGARSGFDLSLAHTLAQELPVPALIGGDGRTPVHFAEAFECGVVGAVIGEVLHDGTLDIGRIKALLAERELPARPADADDAPASRAVSPATDEEAAADVARFVDPEDLRRAQSPASAGEAADETTDPRGRAPRPAPLSRRPVDPEAQEVTAALPQTRERATRGEPESAPAKASPPSRGKGKASPPAASAPPPAPKQATVTASEAAPLDDALDDLWEEDTVADLEPDQG